MHILVVGAGATGGYFGARLADAGREVTFLVRPRRAEALRAGGLRISSPHGDLRLAPQLAVTGDAPARPAEAVLLAVKAYALDTALEDLAPHVGPDTVIVPLLNGMAHLDRLDARFGAAAVLGGVCRVATTVAPDGGIKQLAPFQDLSYGERDGRDSARVDALDAALSGAGFRTEKTGRILQQMWDKWILLAAGGAACCLLRGNVGEMAAAGGAPTAARILGEAVAVAAAAGYGPAGEVRANAERMLTAAGSGFATSMYRDMVAGAPVEGDHIVGDMVRRAGAAGVDVPLLAAAAAALDLYSRRRAAAGQD